jgi:hypothetical protein
MIVCPPIAIVDKGSYYAMIRVTYIWVLVFLIVGVYIKCGIRSNIEMDASTLYLAIWWVFCATAFPNIQFLGIYVIKKPTWILWLDCIWQGE